VVAAAAAPVAAGAADVAAAAGGDVHDEGCPGRVAVGDLPLGRAAFGGNAALGAGLGFRPSFRGDLFHRRSEVDFLEITADHYFNATPEKRDELDLLAAHFQLIPHGLDLSLGSAEGVDAAYLDQFAALVARISPPWWSEHLAFTRAGGVSIGHLAALPFTGEAVDAVVRNVEKVRRVIQAPLILENITVSVQVPGGEMDEPAFLTEVLQRTGCGWLCDVTNLYTNAVNRGGDLERDLDRELDRWPWDLAVQMHVGGGHWRDGVLIDSHAFPIFPEVWRIVNEAVARSPVKGIILERDENLPPFGDLLGELAQARAILQRHGRWR
jgi:uncharacterized protein (UPF0276 family)